MSSQLPVINKIQYLILALPVVVIFVLLMEAYLSSSHVEYKHSDLVALLLMPFILAVIIFFWWQMTCKKFIEGDLVHTWSFVFKSQVGIILTASFIHSFLTLGLFLLIYFLIPIANAFFYFLIISTWWSPLLYYFVLSSLAPPK